MMIVELYDTETGSRTTLGPAGQIGQKMAVNLVSKFAMSFADALGPVATVLTAAQLRNRAINAMQTVGESMKQHLVAEIDAMNQNALDQARRK